MAPAGEPVTLALQKLYCATLYRIAKATEPSLALFESTEKPEDMLSGCARRSPPEFRYSFKKKPAFALSSYGGRSRERVTEIEPVYQGFRGNCSLFEAF